MPQPPRKKKRLQTKQRDNRERNRRRREAESTPERETRQRKNRERERRRREAESTPERETRQRENRKRQKRRREARQCCSQRKASFFQDKCETGRRPSRRAAIVTAKKISNTVRNYNLKEDPDFDSNASVPPKPSLKTEKARKQKSPTPPPLLPPPEAPVEIGLNMECEEEILSKTQAETLSKAQSHYNLVMKGLRELVQCNVKVIQTDQFGTVILNSPIPFQTIPVKNTVIPTSIPSQTNMVLIRTDAPRIVPVALTVVNRQPSLIIM